MPRLHPVKVSCFEKFLIDMRCVYQRTKGSHIHYKCPNCFRTITFVKNLKEVPVNHIFTNLRTMKINRNLFLNWIEKNC